MQRLGGQPSPPSRTATGRQFKNLGVPPCEVWAQKMTIKCPLGVRTRLLRPAKRTFGRNESIARLGKGHRFLVA
jgi:hypothetical protein